MQTGRNVSREFQVVVTNISENPIRLWDNSNQWGYYNVTFLVTKKDGTKVEIFPKVPFSLEMLLASKFSQAERVVSFQSI